MPGRVIQGFFPAGGPRPLPGSRIAPPVQAKRGGLAAPMVPGPPRPAFTSGAVAQRAGGEGHFAVDALQIGLARGGGAPLPGALLAKMEAAFGADFSAVRVHVGPQAARIGAVAFTTGNDLYFAPGQYQPNSAQGQQLIGHELAHVIQQRQGRVRPVGNGVSVVQDRILEAEADRMGMQAARRAELPMRGAGPIQRQAIGRPAPAHDRAKAAFGGRAIQREIRVSKVDYNPVAEEDERFRHGLFRQDAFTTALAAALRVLFNTNQTTHLRNKANDVVAAALPGGADVKAKDMDRLATKIATKVIDQYQQEGLAAGQHRAAIENKIIELLLGNMIVDHSIRMDRGEETAFDELQQRATSMSRAKQTPNVIPHGSLPQALKLGVESVLTDIRDERARWTIQTVQHLAYTSPGEFQKEITARQKLKHYQGNHSNQSQWLPVGNAPVDHVSAAAEAFKARIGREASPRLLRRLKTCYANNTDPATAWVHGAHAPAGLLVEYQGFLQQFVADAAQPGGTDTDVKLSAMAAMCLGVSPYIEFNLHGPISRVIFNPVTSRLYLSAHYKWRNGYNPFFEVTGFPAV